jgi:hypothetical protein
MRCDATSKMIASLDGRFVVSVRIDGVVDILDKYLRIRIDIPPPSSFSVQFHFSSFSVHSERF